MDDVTFTVSGTVSVDRLQRLLADLADALDHLPAAGQPDAADKGDSEIIRQLKTMIDNQRKTIRQFDERSRKLTERYRELESRYQELESRCQKPESLKPESEPA